METQANDHTTETAVRFRLDYSRDKEWIEVKVTKLKALPREAVAAGSAAEVQVRVALMPDERRVFTEVARLSMTGGGRDAELDVTFVIPVRTFWYRTNSIPGSVSLDVFRCSGATCTTAA